MGKVHTVEVVDELVQLLGKTREDVLTAVLESMACGLDGSAYIELATLEQKLELRKGFFQEVLNLTQEESIQYLRDQIKLMITERDFMKLLYKQIQNSPDTKGREEKIMRLRSDYLKLIISRKRLEDNLKQLESDRREPAVM